MRITILVGSPKPESRRFRVAEAVAVFLADPGDFGNAGAD